MKLRYGVPPGMAGCHTGVVGEYVVEGHVPAGDIERMLGERHAILGLAVPGMPIGSPGMEIAGIAPVPYDVIAFDASGFSYVFARR